MLVEKDIRAILDEYFKNNSNNSKDLAVIDILIAMHKDNIKELKKEIGGLR